MPKYKERATAYGKVKHLVEVGQNTSDYTYYEQSVCGSLWIYRGQDGYHKNTKGKRLCKRCDSYTMKHLLDLPKLEKTYSID